MLTESSVFEALLSDLIGGLERKVSRIVTQEELTDEDVIELAALECLLERLDGLDGYASGS